MGYVSTCGWLGLDRHDVKEGKGRREGRGVGQKTTTEISLVRALSSSALCVMDGIVHVTPRTAVAKKKPLTQRKEKKEQGKSVCVREREHEARC